QGAGFGNLLPVDRAARAEVGRRLEKALTEAARKGDVPRRLAVAHAIGAMGEDIPPITPSPAKGDEPPPRTAQTSRGFASSLAPILIRLCQDPEPAVRTAAARALGRINPEPGPTAAALKALLAGDEVGPRRAAAEALCSLVEIPSQLPAGGCGADPVAAAAIGAGPQDERGGAEAVAPGARGPVRAPGVPAEGAADARRRRQPAVR